MTAGRKIVVAARAAGILLGVWALLALTGWVAGVLPPVGGELRSEVAATSQPSGAVDAGTAPVVPDAGDDAGAVPAVLATADDAGQTPASAEGQNHAQETGQAEPQASESVTDGVPREATSAEPPADDALWSVRITERAPGIGENAALGVGSVVGDSRPEILVAVGGETHVVGLHEGRPLRVATIGAPGPAAPARPLAADVTGDGVTDLVVGYARLGPEGGPTGGTLQLLPGNPRGALDEPRVLAPIAVTGLVSTSIGSGESQRGAPLAAANWTDGFGRRASELWTFAGGASPVRRGRARLRDDVTDVVSADLDGDGVRELVALDAQGLTRVSFEGARLGLLDLSRPTHALVCDFDGDGTDDLLALAEGLHLVRGGVTPLELHPVDAPSGLRRLVAHDVDGDGRVDVVGVTREGVVVLQQQDAFFFSEQRPITTPLLFRPHDLAIVDLGGGSVLVLVGAGPESFEVMAVPLGRRVVVGATSSGLGDAPLHLQIPLR